MSTLTSAECKRLDEDGYLVLEDLIDRKRLAAMRERLEELLAITPQDHAGTLVVGGLLDEPVFDAAWSHPRILAAIRHVLRDEPRLLGVSSRGLRPGHGQQSLHVDWGNVGDPGVWYGCHAICALVEFTQENGATRIVPGSHRNPWMMKGRWGPKAHPSQKQLVGSAGTIFILNIHCAHSAVHNSSQDARLALFANFSRRDSPILLANPPQEPGAAVLARHPIAIQALLMS